jgi:hypothetical protein
MSDPAPDPAPADPAPQEGNPDDLPQWARDAITKANKEAATYRTRAKELEPYAQKAQELEEASKSDLEKLTAERDQLRSQLDGTSVELLRLQVALDKGLDHRLAPRLTGATREELEADADSELWETFRSGGEETPRPPGRPTEALRGGGAPAQEPEPDIRKVVESIPRGF